MNNTLLIKLEENFDYAMIASTLRLLSQNTSIHILTSNTHGLFFEYFENIQNIHVIDFNFLKSITNGKMYSQSISINHINQHLIKLEQIKWDTIVNFDNSKDSALLTGLFVSENTFTVGHYVSTNNRTHYNNKWSKLLRLNAEVGKSIGLFNFDLVKKHFFKNIKENTNILKRNDRLLLTARENFGQIKVNHNKKNIIEFYGISLMSFNTTTSLSNDYLLNILEFIYKIPGKLPVLISSGEESEKRIADYLNEKLDNKIITITCTKNAVSPILSELSLIISSPSVHIALADTLGVKSILLKDNYLDENTFYTTTNGSFEIKYENPREAVTETCNIIKKIDNQKNSSKSLGMLTSLVNSHDSFGLLKLPATENFDVDELLKNYISRTLQSLIIEGQLNYDLMEHIKSNTDVKKLNEIKATFQSEIKRGLAITLSCIRALKGYKLDPQSKKLFIKCLDDLINLASTSEIIKTPLLLFEFSLDELQQNSLDTNIKSIETLLFNLKDNLGHAIMILTIISNPSEINHTAQLEDNE